MATPGNKGKLYESGYVRGKYYEVWIEDDDEDERPDRDYWEDAEHGSEYMGYDPAVDDASD